MTKNRMRLSVDIDIEIHRRLKHIAVDLNCSITEYVTRILLEALAREEFYLNKGDDDDEADNGFDGNGELHYDRK
jgi:hypothetical protein